MNLSKISQVQLDTYGEVLDAAWEYVRHKGAFDRATEKRLMEFGDAVLRRWREPDDGIWEIRSGRRHNTHSKVLCWAAMDRLIRLHDEGHLAIDVDRFTREREAIRQEIETRGYDEGIGSYVTAFGYHDVDASLLLMSAYGYKDAADPRMLGTYHRIRERLYHDGLYYRYDPQKHQDGLPPGEGMFLMVGYWAIAHRARMGEVDGAIEDFERMLTYANDLGLFGEEIDRDGKRPDGPGRNRIHAHSLVGKVKTEGACECHDGTLCRSIIEQRRVSGISSDRGVEEAPDE